MSWLDKLGNAPDHPMTNVDAAKQLLAELPEDDPLEALKEISDWMNSFGGTPGFKPGNRLGVSMLLDDTAAPIYAEVKRGYTAASHLQDLEGMKLWRAMHEFAIARIELFAVCLRELTQSAKKNETANEQTAIVCVRFLRSVIEQLKLELMRYMDVQKEVWENLCRGYQLAEEAGLAETMVIAYPGHVIHSSPQRELLCALVLFESAPGALSSSQIEMSSRIAARLSSFFDLAREYSAETPYLIDLAHPAMPKWIAAKPEVGESMRFFGASRAVSRLEEIIHQNERGQVEEEYRFESEFTPEGKLTMLKHLLVYWSKEHVHRNQDRHAIQTEIEVVRSLKTISKLVKHFDIGEATNLSEEDAAQLKERSGFGLVGEEIKYTSETWPVLDISTEGVGGIVPRTTGDWVKIGALCGLKGKNANQWWVGMIRRLKTDMQGKVHVGIRVLTKQPLSVWLRVLGKGAERVSNWQTSSGSFAFDYLPVILIPDEHNSYVHATMLMECGSFVVGTLFEVMLGEKSRTIKLVAIIAEGDDYEQVSFEWQ
ncbi:MAG: hypothetical protein KKH12_03720 [Gammaproteobacteria bacterium]|nr:hypothetical protein [Gammaproteobacteria bacterium]MBU1480764.1 hypothetical protein [Gammaproteobacteria bacterium]